MVLPCCMQLKLAHSDVATTKWSSAFRVRHVNQKMDVQLKGPAGYLAITRLHSMLADDGAAALVSPRSALNSPGWPPPAYGAQQPSMAAVRSSWNVPGPLSAVPEGHETLHSSLGGGDTNVSQGGAAQLPLPPLQGTRVSLSGASVSAAGTEAVRVAVHGPIPAGPSRLSQSTLASGFPRASATAVAEALEIQPEEREP